MTMTQPSNTALTEDPSSALSLPANRDLPLPLANGATGPEDTDNELIPVGGGAGIPFNGNQVRTAVSGLPPEHREPIIWLYELGREQRWDLGTLAKKLRREKKGTYEYTTLYRVFQGKYAGALDNVVAAINTFREVHENRERIARPAFVETELSRKLWGICDRARTFNRVAMVFGDGQTGKTKSLEEYRNKYKSTTRYLRLPTEASLRTTVQLLAEACFLNTERSTTILRDGICRAFDSEMVLIVDELQQITLARTGRDRLITVEFLREIFDRSGCGLVLCGTNEAMKEMDHGANAVWLRQLRRRAFSRITLPNVASDADILAFAAHFGLGEEMPDRAVAETRRIAADDGVGVLITYLQGAARMAAAEHKRTTWEHFLRTVRAFAEEGKTQH